MPISIVRVGSSNDELSQSVTNAIVGYLSLKDNKEQQENNGNGNLIQISNRYFDAKVLLKTLDILSAEGEEPTTTADSEDGIILVFDDTSKESFDVLAQLHGKAETNQQNGDLLRLCIGVLNNDNTTTTTTMTTKQIEEEYSRRVLWCLDSGYEYIEKVDLSPTGIQQGHEAREKEGFARIIEALMGTVWSSAKMHPKKKLALQTSYQKDTQQLTTAPQSQAQAQAQSTAAKEDANNSTYEPPLPSATTTTTTTENDATTTTISEQEDKQREESARKALLEQDGIANTAKENENNSKQQYIDGDGKSTSQQRGEERMREQKADKIMSDMEGALKEANRIRNMSKAGELSDDERKQRAGDAATLILNLMNQMGGLDDDSEEEEDGN